MKRRLLIDTLIVALCQVMSVALIGYFIWLAFTLLTSGSSEYVESVSSSTPASFVFLGGSMMIVLLVLVRRRTEPTTGKLGIYLGLIGLCPVIVVASVWILYPKNDLLTSQPAKLITDSALKVDHSSIDRLEIGDSPYDVSTRGSNRPRTSWAGASSATADLDISQTPKLPALTVKLTISGSKAMLNSDGSVLATYKHTNYDHGLLYGGFVSRSEAGLSRSVLIPHDLTNVVRATPSFGSSTFSFDGRYHVWQKDTGEAGLRLEGIEPGELLLFAKNWTHLLGWKRVTVPDAGDLTEEFDLNLSSLGQLQLTIPYHSPQMVSETRESADPSRPERERYMVYVYPIVDRARLGPIEFPLFGSTPTTLQLLLPGGRYDVRCGDGGVEVEVDPEGLQKATLIQKSEIVNGHDR